MGLTLAVRASGSVSDVVVLEELDMKAVIAAAKKGCRRLQARRLIWEIAEHMRQHGFI